jgi:hypothetical protein
MFNNYVITLYNKEDVESFISDLEQGKIIERSVLPKVKKLDGKGLIYQISIEEVDIIKQDPRVKAI